MIINDLDGYYIVFDTKNWNTELDTLFFNMVVFTLLLVLGISSCGKPELKKIRGIVKNVRIDDDTLKNLTVMDGEDSIVFNLNEVRYNNGVMLPNDSVIVDYIDGKNDTARALVVTVLPKNAVTINPEDNQSKKLITAPIKSN